jgi:N,N'-diacetylchitobiose transport system permease protein
VQGSTPHFWPDQLTLNNFVNVVTKPSGSIEFLPALTTSLVVTLSTVVFALLFAFFAALALTRFRFRSKRTLIVLLLVAQMIPAEAMIVSIFRVTLPLLGPGLTATGVFAFIQAWNEFTFALVVMNKPDTRTLPVWLNAFVQATQATDWAAIMAGSTLMAIPVIIFFLLVQGRMASGLAAGAVKG